VDTVLLELDRVTDAQTNTLSHAVYDVRPHRQNGSRFWWATADSVFIYDGSSFDTMMFSLTRGVSLMLGTMVQEDDIDSRSFSTVQARRIYCNDVHAVRQLPVGVVAIDHGR
jgi:hypothetical protein